MRSDKGAEVGPGLRVLADQRARGGAEDMRMTEFAVLQRPYRRSAHSQACACTAHLRFVWRQAGPVDLTPGADQSPSGYVAVRESDDEQGGRCACMHPRLLGSRSHQARVDAYPAGGKGRTSKRQRRVRGSDERAPLSR
ncbi:hypothetical protein Purlil1_14320 [Purpureocillium lilacinum]|uniref:Uncharacterized protein n=1 Tax=Purpureocillium lilacinum TaxID=33203 RepID=A0ABR0BBX7_PURLI|nr:hypothetical protein Purlil1_14320 [Purpureocillium lilacinum]